MLISPRISVLTPVKIQHKFKLPIENDSNCNTEFNHNANVTLATYHRVHSLPQCWVSSFTRNEYSLPLMLVLATQGDIFVGETFSPLY